MLLHFQSQLDLLLIALLLQALYVYGAVSRVNDARSEANGSRRGQ